MAISKQKSWTYQHKCYTTKSSIILCNSIKPCSNFVHFSKSLPWNKTRLDKRLRRNLRIFLCLSALGQTNKLNLREINKFLNQNSWIRFKHDRVRTQLCWANILLWRRDLTIGHYWTDIVMSKRDLKILVEHSSGCNIQRKLYLLHGQILPIHFTTVFKFDTIYGLYLSFS